MRIFVIVLFPDSQSGVVINNSLIDGCQIMHCEHVKQRTHRNCPTVKMLGCVGFFSSFSLDASLS